MTIGFTYLNHGSGELKNLLVSIISLRKFWQGPITICDTGETDQSVLADIAKSQKCELAMLPVPAWYPRKDAAFAHQIPHCLRGSLHHIVLYDYTIYLDSDTLIVADLTDLLEVPMSVEGACGMVLTQQGTDTMQTQRAQLQNNDWLRSPYAELCQMALDSDLPAVDAGVMGWMLPAASAFLDEYEKMCLAMVVPRYLNEPPLQMLMTKYAGTKILSARYNADSLADFATRDVVIWHLKSESQYRQGHPVSTLWRQTLHQAYKDNIAEVAYWGGNV